MTDSGEHIRPLNADKSYSTFGSAEDIPVPEISKKHKLNWVASPPSSYLHGLVTLLCTGFFSGVASCFVIVISIKLEGFGFSWGPGIIFAVLVILPWCFWERIRPVLTFFTFVLTPVGYFCAIHLWFKDRLEDVGVVGINILWINRGWVGVGAVGSAIMLAPILLFGEWKTRIAAAVTVLLGWLIVPAFVFLSDKWERGPGGTWLDLVFLLFLWQIVVAGGLSFAFRRKLQPS